MTLEQAVTRALQQNPDLVMVRLDEQRARYQVSITNDPFSFKVGVGAGYAYNNGFPSSINGNPPSIFQAQAKRAVYDQPTTLRVASARESAAGTAWAVRQREEEIAYQVSSTFIDAEHATRSAEAYQSEIRNLEQVATLVQVRVTDGRELPIELSRARSKVTTARAAAQQFQSTVRKSQTALAQILGFPAGDLVQPALEERTIRDLPVSQQKAIDDALASSNEIRRLESDLRAKQLERKSYDAERLPKINFFGSYALLARFNNFAQYYNNFQTNNGQIGLSFEIPLFVGSAPKAYLAQAEIDLQKIQRELDRTKSRITGNIQDAYTDLDLAQTLRDARREELDVARQNTSLQLTLSEEGRATQAQLEAARAEEQASWIQYYEAQRTLDLAQLNVRRTTGTVLAGMR